YGLTIDQLIARYDGTNWQWYLTDKLGSVRQIMDTAGNVLDQIDYDSFGKVVNETTPANGDRFKFTAREWDSEIAQYYYRARFYQPTVGRFLSEDPVGARADSNFYRYVHNRPHQATDPTGLQNLEKIAIFRTQISNVRYLIKITIEKRNQLQREVRDCQRAAGV